MGVHIETWSGSDCGVMTSLLGMQWSAQYGHVFGVEMMGGLYSLRVEMDQVGSLLWRDDGKLGSCWRWRERGKMDSYSGLGVIDEAQDKMEIDVKEENVIA